MILLNQFNIHVQSVQYLYSEYPGESRDILFGHLYNQNKPSPKESF